MDIQPQCPGEPYTITSLICRARQAKAYEKCPGCAHRERVNAMPAEVAPSAPAPLAMAMAAPDADGLGRELEAAGKPAALRFRLPRLPNAAAGIGLGAAALHETGFGSVLKRIYHYF